MASAWLWPVVSVRSRRTAATGAAHLKVILKPGPLPGAHRTHWTRPFTASGRPPDALDSGFHCARTHSNRGFIAFQLARRIRAALLMVPVCPESDFQGRAARLRSTS